MADQDEDTADDEDDDYGEADDLDDEDLFDEGAEHDPAGLPRQAEWDTGPAGGRGAM
jgi:hypothetical protein